MAKIIIMSDSRDEVPDDERKHVVMTLKDLRALLCSQARADSWLPEDEYLHKALAPCQEPDEPVSIIDLDDEYGTVESFSDDTDSWLEELERIRYMAAAHLYEAGTGPDRR